MATTYDKSHQYFTGNISGFMFTRRNKTIAVRKEFDALVELGLIVVRHGSSQVYHCILNEDYIDLVKTTMLL